MNEKEFAGKLKSRLSNAPLSPAVSDRLRLAREAAVSVASKRSAGGSFMHGGAIVRFWHQHQTASIGLLLVLLLALSGSGWHWRQAREADRAMEVALLADDLPVELLLNERFDQWTRP